jgi:hypothetical protein
MGRSGASRSTTAPHPIRIRRKDNIRTWAARVGTGSRASGIPRVIRMPSWKSPIPISKPRRSSPGGGIGALRRAARAASPSHSPPRATPVRRPAATHNAPVGEERSATSSRASAEWYLSDRSSGIGGMPMAVDDPFRSRTVERSAFFDHDLQQPVARGRPGVRLRVPGPQGADDL